jgi:hypothetical protein
MPRMGNITTSRDGALDLLKCVLVLGVVLQHSGFARFNAEEQELVANLRHFFSLVVVGFFWAAGYLIDVNERADVFLKKRFMRLIVPFLVISIVNWIIFLSLARVTGRSFGYDYTIGDMLHVLFTLQGVGPQMYFLPYLFLLQTAAFFSARRFASPALLAALSILLLLLWFATDPNFKNLGPSPGNIALYASSVFLGMACRHADALLVGKFVLVVAIPILAGCAVLAPGVWHDLCCWAAPPAMYVGFKACGARAAWPGLSGDTFAVFLWHTPLLMPLLSLFFVRLFPAGYLALLLTVVGAICLSVAVGRTLRMLPAARSLGIA